MKYDWLEEKVKDLVRDFKVYKESFWKSIVNADGKQ